MGRFGPAGGKMTDRTSPQTFSGPFSGGSEFATPSFETWRQMATDGLKGRTLNSLTTPIGDGVDIKVLYTSDDKRADPGLPGTFPFTRGGALDNAESRSWENCALYTHPDIDVAARQMAEETRRDAQSVWVRLSCGIRFGIDSQSPQAAQWSGDGVIAENVGDFERLFEGIDPVETPVHLEAGGNAVAAAAAFIASVRRRNIAPETIRGSFNLDPLGALVCDGTLVYGLDRSFEMAVSVAAWCLEHMPGIRALSVSTVPYHGAGATPVQELAFALATGIEWLRTLEHRGLEPDEACRQIKFLFATGRDFFTEAAKLRAFRRIWAQAAASCGVNGPEAAAIIHTVSSMKNLTVRDPWVNLLRVTVGAFAATVGGADEMTTLPFDTLIGPSDPLGRRMALNTQTICREECHLDQVIDPGGGSWFIEALTDDLARAAWTLFQEIEAKGGMRQLITDGGLSTLLAPAAERERRNTARRKSPVTGVSTWPNLDEKAVTRNQPDVQDLLDRIAARRQATSSSTDVKLHLARLAHDADSIGTPRTLMDTAIQAADAGATLAQLADALQTESQPSRTLPLPRVSDAAPFERLRDISDEILAATGSRPTIFLACLGPMPEHTARATFAKNFFEAGGFETVVMAGSGSSEEAILSFQSSSATFACICSSDSFYDEGAAPLAQALNQAGAQKVCLAGRPGANESRWREAGIDHFIFVGCDLLETLSSLMQETGLTS